jgi:hypothetical protein
MCLERRKACSDVQLTRNCTCFLSDFICFCLIRNQYLPVLGAGDPNMDPYAPQDTMSQLAMSMPINEQQLAIANTHLYSIQTMSGAQVQVSGCHC